MFGSLCRVIIMNGQQFKKLYSEHRLHFSVINKNLVGSEKETDNYLASNYCLKVLFRCDTFFYLNFKLVGAFQMKSTYLKMHYSYPLLNKKIT